jgi:ABC-type bacteriocin/lantibiotic exporter with double-glycine peptidase domain
MRYIAQLDEPDCGAACLAMAASHFGVKKSIASIREAAGTDKHGTNLAGMVQAAQRLGFSAKALKGDSDALKPSLPLPFIAPLPSPVLGLPSQACYTPPPWEGWSSSSTRREGSGKPPRP